MDFFNDEKKNILIVILIIIIIALGACIFIVFKNGRNEELDKSEVLEKVEELAEVEDEIDKEEEVEYYVDIKGAVKKPGVYKVVKGSIVNDVISAAGGLKSNASTKYINLSYELNNHDVINIFTVSEVKNNKINMECNCSSIDLSICDNSSIISTNNDENKTNNTDILDKDVVKGKVNINTASKEELMSINGIGESKALAIIEYRNSTKFTKIEDIMNVSGIGESLYNSIKENITV